MANNGLYETKSSDLNPKWHHFDAENQTLGRLSSMIAKILQGKHKPNYVPHLNTGDFIVVTNVEKIRATGQKLSDKMYYQHSGYHGGLRTETLSDILEKNPERVLRKSVKGMLPKNSMGRHMLSRLKLYSGSEHPHQAQLGIEEK
ncbi:MAG: 50S ribosomal protein L13 [Chloroflexi bacterium]|nr:50S ribosomal protein L13 [Chloroflexota bacterium]|tara:strand:+ start:384 stop:818 length:435 start_codon:yes stop_codon:yes gene_type:complete